MSPVTVVRPVTEQTDTEQAEPLKTVRSPAGLPEAGAVVTLPPINVAPEPVLPAPRTSGYRELGHIRVLDDRRALTGQRSQTLWRARALRYVLIYLLMGCALVALRYQTWNMYPQLRELRAVRTALQNQQRELSLRVQTLTSEQRVRAWALGSGMVPYAQASKQTQVFAAPLTAQTTLTPPAAAPALAPLSVRTAWK